METGSLLILCVLGAGISLLLAVYKPEYSMLSVIAAGLIIFVSALAYIVPQARELSSLLDAAGIENWYFETAFRALGVCLLSQFAADICRDFGQSALASKAEFIGRCAVFALSLPLIKNILQTAVSLIG